MIIYGNDKIYKWALWRKKGKLLFCLSSGLIFGTGMAVISLLLRLFRNTSLKLWSDISPVFFGGMVAASLFSIILWYQNDDRYREWIKREQTKK